MNLLNLICPISSTLIMLLKMFCQFHFQQKFLIELYFEMGQIHILEVQFFKQSRFLMGFVIFAGVLSLCLEEAFSRNCCAILVYMYCTDTSSRSRVYICPESVSKRARPNLGFFVEYTRQNIPVKSRNSFLSKVQLTNRKRRSDVCRVVVKGVGGGVILL